MAKILLGMIAIFSASFLWMIYISHFGSNQKTIPEENSSSRELGCGFIHIHIHIHWDVGSSTATSTSIGVLVHPHPHPCPRAPTHPLCCHSLQRRMAMSEGRTFKTTLYELCRCQYVVMDGDHIVLPQGCTSLKTPGKIS